MDKRITIGLLFSYDENWIAGSYYILNLIHSLNKLEECLKPNLIILSEKEDDFDVIKEINYPFIEFKILPEKLSVVSTIINKISIKLFFKRSLIKNVDASIDILFPSKVNQSLSWIKKHLFWVPDFQELHLPEFYPNANLELRKKNRTVFSRSKKNVIFSSKNALDDYNFFFPNNNTKNYILNFAVFHPVFSNLDEEVKAKYDLVGKNYFFSPNQFWKHKNHIVILKALTELKLRDKLTFTVAFSGKETDYRNPTYFEELNKYIMENGLQDNVKFLGFIDRKEQLYLMNNAVAIVQPSLFEGWSTVIEDTKRLNQNCIASNLKVHQEQLGKNGFYFDPNNEKELALLLDKFINKTIPKPNFDYEEKSSFFGFYFMEIVKEIVK